MNRRDAIGNIVMISIGAVILPSCGQKDPPLVQLRNISLTGSEEKMVFQLADTILPKTSFFGAADLKAHEFTLMMVDDCYEPDKQISFMAGLKEFDQLVRNKYNNSFSSCAPAHRIAWLASLEKKTGIPEAVIFFYETTKRHTVQSFTSCREYMTGVIKYNMVPGGNFKGCVPVKPA
ncbi:MAG: gluconate 2-dehydrogenase subunit 3 family protein [Ferruginibacter sp.]